jgi:hypothetical protein
MYSLSCWHCIDTTDKYLAIVMQVFLASDFSALDSTQ